MSQCGGGEILVWTVDSTGTGTGTATVLDVWHDMSALRALEIIRKRQEERICRSIGDRCVGYVSSKLKSERKEVLVQ